MPQMRLREESQFGDAYPSLWEWLADARWDDGSPRTTATLLLFVEEGRWKLCLHDRDASRTAFLSGETPEAALRSLEAALASEGLEWRAKATKAPSAARGSR